MIMQDLVYAWRTMRKNALLTLTIVCTLGIGIGANTAMFSVLNTIALRSPLALPNPDQLYTINSGEYIGSSPENARFSGPMFEALAKAAPSGVGVAAMSRTVARAYVRRDGERETASAGVQLVSANFLSVLGVSPSLGAGFPAPTSGISDTNEPLAIVSYGYWQRQLGGSPNVIGRTITINGAAFVIVGVGPRDFTGVWLDAPVDIWVPLSQQSTIKYSQSFSANQAALGKPWLPQPGIWWLHVVVRAPREAAGPAAGAFGASLTALNGSQTRTVLEPFGRGFSRVRQQFSTPLMALMLMASLVLLIACANVANVLLARAIGRQREIAVRVAIGANRGRLIRQLLTESTLLVTIAAVAAVLFAGWAADALVRLATATGDGMAPLSTRLDLRVLAFAGAMALLSVLAFGLWPAWRGTRVDLVGSLKSSTHGAFGRGARPARILVSVQVALSLVLVTGTGLFVRSFQHLLDVGVGFETARLLSVTIEPRLSGTSSRELPAMMGRVLDAVSSVPGVESAALAMCGLQGPCSRAMGLSWRGTDRGLVKRCWSASTRSRPRIPRRSAYGSSRDAR
jgi:putative ABC transport system permease protein